MTKCFAYAVDLWRHSASPVRSAATDADAADREARQYLELHAVVEVWGNDHRRFARLVRN
jgi:hypothetical protein